MTSLWGNIRRFLQQYLNAEEFSQWVQPVKAKLVDRGHLILQVPTRFHSEWIREHYIPLMYAHCERERIPLDIRLQVAAKGEKLLSHSELSHRHSLVSTQFQPSQNFATFIVAPFNQFAFTAARSICDGRSVSYSPLFIEGPPGLGKTHLLQAIGNARTANRPGSVGYLECRRLVEHKFAFHGFSLSPLRQSLKEMEAFLIDDVHLLPSDGNLQQYILEIFNDFYDLEKLLVITGTRLPQQIPELLPGLRSRFSWGLIARITEPDITYCSQLVETLLAQAGLPFSPELCELLTEDGPVNFHNLRTSVEKLQEVFQERGELPDIRQFLLSLSSKDTLLDEVSINSIQQAVCKNYNVSMEALLGSCKTRLLVMARQAGMYLSRKLVGATYASIGSSFGNRDHSTVIYACRKMAFEIKRNRDFAEQIVQIERGLSTVGRKEN